MDKTALVTGSCGFIGRHIARQLARDGWSVIGLGHGSWVREEWEKWGLAEWHAADITLDSLITCGGKPDVIVHCAGGGSVGYSIAHPQQDFQRTVETTLAILEFARMHAPQAKVVYPSSGGVYGEVHKLPIMETDPLAPVSPYGVHKCIAEELCKSYARQYKVAVAVVRLFSVYGAGLRKQLLWDASKKIMNGETEFFGTGEEVRDWLHIEDAASLLITAAKYASAECPIVNGGSGKGTSVREVLTELFNCFDLDETPGFSGELRGGDPKGYVAAISLAGQWGWQPRKILKDGLHEYVEWFKGGAQ